MKYRPSSVNFLYFDSLDEDLHCNKHQSFATHSWIREDCTIFNPKTNRNNLCSVHKQAEMFLSVLSRSRYFTRASPSRFKNSIAFFSSNSLKLPASEQEIERKFKPSDEVLKRLQKFTKSTQEMTFTDIYFDNKNHSLTCQDFWLRLRNDTLELKSPSKATLPSDGASFPDGLHGIDFYDESRDLADIAQRIQKVASSIRFTPPPLLDQTSILTWLEQAALTSFAKITTSRTRYTLEMPLQSGGNRVHKVHVDIDRCDFHVMDGEVVVSSMENNTSTHSRVYTIGEVELVEAAGSVSAEQALQQVFEDLGIQTTPVRGKVLEYLYSYRHAHFLALQASGVLASKMLTAPAPMMTAPSEKSTSAATTLLNNSAVNIFFTRKCNFACKFCFHTAKTSFVLPVEKLTHIMSLLRQSGAEKLNFAGGEPFLPSYQPLLGELVKSAKKIGFSSVSIISNGSHAHSLSPWFDTYAGFLDILGISCDSMYAETNFKIGRHYAGAKQLGNNDTSHLEKVRFIAQLCSQHGVKFKISTVVNALNQNEDMSVLINEVKPMRWKIFQVLPLQGENCGPGAKRNVDPLLISKHDFDAYVNRNTSNLFDPSIVEAEDNAAMQSSYISIDEYGRFLDSSSGGKVPTQAILDVGIETAASELLQASGGGFDRDAFYSRGGYYPDKWSRENNTTSSQSA